MRAEVSHVLATRLGIDAGVKRGQKRSICSSQVRGFRWRKIARETCTILGRRAKSFGCTPTANGFVTKLLRTVAHWKSTSTGLRGNALGCNKMAKNSRLRKAPVMKHGGRHST